MALPDVEWITDYPTAQDPDPIESSGRQNDLTNESAFGAGDGHNTRVSQLHALRDKLQEVARRLGANNALPTGCVLDRVGSTIDPRIKLLERASAPSPISNTGFLYTKDIAGLTEIFYIDAVGTEIQLTANGQLASETKSHRGIWQSGTTVNFSSRPGQSSLVRLVLQDGKYRSISGTLNWDDANGVADLGWDEAASQAAGDKHIYFYAVPSAGDDNILSVRASDNPHTIGPTGYTNFKLIWSAYRLSGSLLEVHQIGNKFLYSSLQTPTAGSVATLGTSYHDPKITISLEDRIPKSAGTALLRPYVNRNSSVGFSAVQEIYEDGAASFVANNSAAVDAFYFNEFYVEVQVPGTVKQIGYRTWTDNPPTIYIQSQTVRVSGWIDEVIDP